MTKQIKTRDLTRVKGKVYNTPLLITEEALLPITEYLKNPVRTGFESQQEDDFGLLVSQMGVDFTLSDYDQEQIRRMKVRAGIDPDTNIGTIPIEGVLVSKAGQVDGCVELTSYERLIQKVETQISLGVRHIIYMVDSGGGDAYQNATTAKKLRQITRDYGIRTTAYVDGSACSAAYMLASSADEVVSNPESSVGSIGVLVQLINNTKNLEKNGYERTFITAGANKIPFNDDGTFQKEFLDRIQTRVDRYYKSFTTGVAEMRNIPVEDVIKTEAQVFDADEALALNLIDKVMGYDEFSNYMQSKTMVTSSNTNIIMNNKETKIMSEKDNKDNPQASDALANQEKLQADLVQAQASIEQLTTSLATLQSSYDALVKEKADADALLIVTQRTNTLKALMGSENESVDSIVASTMLLSDDQFAVIAQSYKGQVEKMDDSHTEVGDGGEDTKTQKDTASDLSSQLAAKAKARK